MRYAYKCVAAPRRARRAKGHKTANESFCATFETVLSEHAAAGWEYLRTDLVPVEMRKGLFGGLQEVHQGVMVFRRALGPGDEVEIEEAAEPAPARPSAPAPERSEPEVDVPRLGAARID